MINACATFYRRVTTNSFSFAQEIFLSETDDALQNNHEILTLNMFVKNKTFSFREFLHTNRGLSTM